MRVDGVVCPGRGHGSCLDPGGPVQGRNGRRGSRPTRTRGYRDSAEYLTGFHKRKVERRKIALEEIKRKLKQEQQNLKEERHKQYMKMLKEREAALDEADQLDYMVTSQREVVSYDHPNHTVTVTTVSDLDLSGARLLGLDTHEEDAEPEREDSVSKTSPCTLPKKSKDPFLSQRISSLTASLHSRSQKKAKGKQTSCSQRIKKKAQKPCTGRTSKSQRRKMTGKGRRVQD